MLPMPNGDSGELRDLVKDYVRLASSALVDAKQQIERQDAIVRQHDREIAAMREVKVVERIQVVDDALRKHGEQLAALQVKAGLWGLLGGLIPAIGAAIYFLLK